MYKKISASLLALAIFTVPAVASAHIVVKPGIVNVGEFTTFNVSVPNEKTIPVTTVKLDIPAGIKTIKPTTKTGWTVVVEKTGEGAAAKATSITWSGGSIPAEQRDDFSFSSQAPAKPTDLNWSAYETYEDGTVVSWNQPPTAKETDDETVGPYSVTKVVDDLTAETVASESDAASGASSALPLLLSGLAVAISLGTLLFKKKA